MFTDNCCGQLDSEAYLQPDDSSLHSFTLGESAWICTLFCANWCVSPQLPSEGQQQLLQSAATTMASLQLRTILKGQVFAKQLCLFVGFVPLLKKRGTSVGGMYSLTVSAPAAIPSERAQSNKPDAFTWIAKLCVWILSQSNTSGWCCEMLIILRGRIRKKNCAGDFC